MIEFASSPKNSKFSTAKKPKKNIIMLKKTSTKGEMIRAATAENSELYDGTIGDLQLSKNKSELPSIDRNTRSRRSTETNSKLISLKSNLMLNQSPSQNVVIKRKPIKIVVTKEMIRKRKLKFLQIANKGAEAFCKLRKAQDKPPLPGNTPLKHQK